MQGGNGENSCAITVREWLLLVKLAQKRYVKCLVATDGYAAPEEACEQHACGECDRVFGAVRALRAHERAAHGFRSWTADWVVDSICPCCQRQFWTTWRLRRHLDKGSFRCALHVRLLGEQPDPEEVQAARRAEASAREQAKKGGASLDTAVLPAMHLREALHVSC